MNGNNSLALCYKVDMIKPIYKIGIVRISNLCFEKSPAFVR